MPILKMTCEIIEFEMSRHRERHIFVERGRKKGRSGNRKIRVKSRVQWYETCKYIQVKRVRVVKPARRSGVSIPRFESAGLKSVTSKEEWRKNMKGTALQLTPLCLFSKNTR
jgi:hypothetical protein